MAPRKKGPFPNNIDKLEKTFYGPKKDGRDVDTKKLGRYLDAVRTEIVSPELEELVVKIFAPIGDLKKIEEDRVGKKFDYVESSERLLVEVTSINVDEATGKLPDDITSKLQVAIGHVAEKDTSGYAGYRVIGVIFYPIQLNIHKALVNDASRVRAMIPGSIDLVIFVLQPSSIVGASSWSEYSPVQFPKDDRAKNIAERLDFAVKSILV